MSEAPLRSAAPEIEDPTPPPAAAAVRTPNKDTWPWVDRRQGGDRRQRPTSILDVFRTPRRRKSGRRAYEQEGIYVDRYHPREVALMASVLVLNILDALFTMLWMQRGGREANPVMDAFIQAGDHFFIIQKCLVVGFFLILLLMHKNFGIARRGMRWLFMLYLGILLLHVGLLLTGADPASRH